MDNAVRHLRPDEREHVIQGLRAQIHRERLRVAFAQAELERRRAQHVANLRGWQEPDGLLVPTEPDAEERRYIRDRLRAAIDETGYALGLLQR